MKPQKIVPVIMMVLLLMFSSCKEAPKVSHPIADRSDASCLVCHQSGMNGAPVTTHPQYKDACAVTKRLAAMKRRNNRINHNL